MVFLDAILPSMFLMMCSTLRCLVTSRPAASASCVGKSGARGWEQTGLPTARPGDLA